MRKNADRMREARINDECRKGLSRVQIVIPPGVDELTPMLRLIIGAVFTVRRHEFPAEDTGAHDHGVVSVLGKHFRWSLNSRRGRRNRTLTIHVPPEPKDTYH